MKIITDEQNGAVVTAQPLKCMRMIYSGGLGYNLFHDKTEARNLKGDVLRMII